EAQPDRLQSRVALSSRIVIFDLCARGWKSYRGPNQDRGLLASCSYSPLPVLQYCVFLMPSFYSGLKPLSSGLPGSVDDSQEMRDFFNHPAHRRCIRAFNNLIELG